ncbi:TPA: hypothetical protein ACH3X1_015727, partial [Trebouxia sp. C0004]
ASGRSHLLCVLADCCVMLKFSNHRLTSVYCTIAASVLVGGLCTCVFAGNTQHFSDDRGPLGRRLLQEADAAVPEPGPDPHTEQLTHLCSGVTRFRILPDAMKVLPQFSRQAWCPAVPAVIGLIHCKTCDQADLQPVDVQ